MKFDQHRIRDSWGDHPVFGKSAHGPNVSPLDVWPQLLNFGEDLSGFFALNVANSHVGNAYARDQVRQVYISCSLRRRHDCGRDVVLAKHMIDEALLVDKTSVAVIASIWSCSSIFVYFIGMCLVFPRGREEYIT